MTGDQNNCPPDLLAHAWRELTGVGVEEGGTRLELELSKFMDAADMIWRVARRTPDPRIEKLVEAAQLVLSQGDDGGYTESAAIGLQEAIDDARAALSELEGKA